MDRKDFIKSGCTLCMLGIALPLFSLDAMTRGKIKYIKSEIINNTISIQLEALKEGNMFVVTAKKMEYEIALVKQIAPTPSNPTDSLHKVIDTLKAPIQTQQLPFNAFYLICTHLDNYLDVNENGFSCSMHGSTFDLNGQVVKGPAEHPLKTLNIVVDNNQLIIHL